MRLMKVYEIEEMPYEVQSAVINCVGKSTFDEYIEWHIEGYTTDSLEYTKVDQYLLDNGSNMNETVLIRQCH